MGKDEYVCRHCRKCKHTKEFRFLRKPINDLCRYCRDCYKELGVSLKTILRCLPESLVSDDELRSVAKILQKALDAPLSYDLGKIRKLGVKLWD